MKHVCCSEWRRVPPIWLLCDALNVLPLKETITSQYLHHVTTADQSQTSIPVTWLLLTNQVMAANVFFLKLVNSKYFRAFIMIIIIINTFTTAFYASYSKSPKDHVVGLKVLEICDSIFLGIYTMEFALKVYIRPRAFFFNGFNCFDTVVLVLSYSQVINRYIISYLSPFP